MHHTGSRFTILPIRVIWSIRSFSFLRNLLIKPINCRCKGKHSVDLLSYQPDSLKVQFEDGSFVDRFLLLRSSAVLRTRLIYLFFSWHPVLVGYSSVGLYFHSNRRRNWASPVAPLRIKLPLEALAEIDTLPSSWIRHQRPQFSS